jgi:hypothetical protein
VDEKCSPGYGATYFGIAMPHLAEWIMVIFFTRRLRDARTITVSFAGKCIYNA